MVIPLNILYSLFISSALSTVILKEVTDTGVSIPTEDISYFKEQNTLEVSDTISSTTSTASSTASSTSSSMETSSTTSVTIAYGTSTNLAGVAITYSFSYTQQFTLMYQSVPEVSTGIIGLGSNNNGTVGTIRSYKHSSQAQ